jgi:hypothetical protein
MYINLVYPVYYLVTKITNPLLNDYFQNIHLGKMMNIWFYYYKKLRVDRLIFINLSQCCAYCRLECVSTSLEKSLKLSLAAFSNVFATLAFSRENSFASSLACCIVFFHASIDANM